MNEPVSKPSLEQIERMLLRMVKFIDVLIQEIRKENKELQEGLGNSYAKYVGLTSPFEECIHSIRKVKVEADTLLRKARSELARKYKKKYTPLRKRRAEKPQAKNPSTQESGEG